MFKRTMFLIAVIAIFILTNTTAITNMSTMAWNSFTDVDENYDWAKEAIDSLYSKNVVSGITYNKFFPASLVTKEQVATMISKGFGITNSSYGQTYVDVPQSRWSFAFVEGTKNIIIRSDDLAINMYDPERPQTRAEVAAACAKAMGLNGAHLKDKNMLPVSYIDYSEIPASISGLVAVATEWGIVKGSLGYLRPNDYVTRAEATVMIYRAMNQKEAARTSIMTPIVDSPHITAEQAASWARQRGAHQRFIDAAAIYWKYGEITGINPEVMYGQAAKETNFGKYTGAVKPEQNNWAGIKIKNPSGDKPEDHETFATPDDGVRAHFNHMSAYVGLAPVGVPHDRYHVVKNLTWAGTVKFAEELSGKWAPAADYGSSLVANYVNAMRGY